MIESITGEWGYWLGEIEKGFSYLGGVLDRNARVVLGEEAVNKVCSHKTRK